MGNMKKINKKIIILLAVLAIGLVNIITIILVKDSGNKFKIDSDSQKVVSEVLENNELGSIKIPGYETVYFPADEKEVQINLVNPEGNKCYFKFQLCVGEETLYSSDLVEEGYSVDTLELAHSLNKGEYELSIKITPYDLENLTQLNGANIKTKLIVY